MVSKRNKEIYHRCKRGETYTSLAKEFGISRSRVKQIIVSIREKQQYTLKIEQGKPASKIEQLVKEGIKEDKINARAGNAVLRYIWQNRNTSVEELVAGIQDGSIRVRNLGKKGREAVTNLLKDFG